MSVLNPNITPRRHRRRPVPGRGRRAPGDGRADRVPQRRAVRPGPHDASSRSSPSSTPAPPSARPQQDRRQGRRSTCSSSAAARPAPRRPIYAARKGIRTGIVAERFGGQVLDTMAHRELHLGARTPKARSSPPRSSSTSREYDVDVMNLPAGDAARARRRARRPRHRRARERRHAAVPLGRAVDRRPLAPDERARRGRVPQQGRDLLPALRRPAVQGQARRGDRRRQLRRRGGDRPRRHRRATSR